MARWKPLTEEQIAARTARYRRLGTTYSRVGAALLAIILVVLIGGGLLVFAADSARREGAESQTLEALKPSLESAVFAVPAYLVVFAAAALIFGEQARRGSFAHRSEVSSPVQPTAQVISRFTPLGYGWHALWAVLGLAVSVFLVGAPALSWVTGGWPHASTYSDEVGGAWIIYGSLGCGIAVASLVSLLKKAVWSAVMARHPERLDSGESSRAWRRVTYRWRLDLWAAGLGGMLVPFSVTFLPYAREDDGGGAATAMAVMIATGSLLIVVGAALSTQYWRAGERIGRGEGAT